MAKRPRKMKNITVLYAYDFEDRFYNIDLEK